jgi:hypothetical protein
LETQPPKIQKQNMLSAHMQSLLKIDLQSISLVVDNPKTHNKSNTTLSCSQLIALSNVVAQRNLNLFASSFVRLALESSRNLRRYTLSLALDEAAAVEVPKSGSFEALVECFLDVDDTENTRAHSSLGIRSLVERSVSTPNPPPVLACTIPSTQSLPDMLMAPTALSRWTSDAVADSFCMTRPPNKPSNQPSVSRRKTAAESPTTECILLVNDDFTEATKPPKEMSGSTSSLCSSSTSLTSLSTPGADSNSQSPSRGSTINGLESSTTKEFGSVEVATTNKKHPSILVSNKDSPVALLSNHAAIMKSGESPTSVFDHRKSSLCKALPKTNGHALLLKGQVLVPVRTGMVSKDVESCNTDQPSDLELIHLAQEKDSCDDFNNNSFANYSLSSINSFTNNSSSHMSLGSSYLLGSFTSNCSIYTDCDDSTGNSSSYDF